MKILCIYKHYWPDITPYARILKAMVERFVEEGHEVVVYTAQPSYNDVKQEHQPWRETLNGVQIIRVPLLPERKKNLVSRLINFNLFLLRSVFHAVRHRHYDLFLFNVHPPVLMGFYARIIKALTRIPYWVHFQDIHPESSLISGRIKVGGLYRFLLKIDTRTAQLARRNIVLSDDMKQSLLARDIPEERISVINNFGLQTYGEAEGGLPPEITDAPEDAFKVIFAGNLGNFQALDNVIEAALLLREHPHIRFFFMGEGLAKDRLVARAGEAVGQTVFFVPQQPVEVALAAMQVCELGIVSLMPEVYKVAFPSKTMMYLSAGCPVITVVEQESNLAGMIQELEFGYSCALEDPRQLADTLMRACDERDQWTPARRAALKEQSDTLFGRPQILDRWVKLLAEDASS